MNEVEVKQQVRQFYDRVGWQLEDGETYQNARYEDLRLVSAEYIHKCHLRINRHLKPKGRFLLDAGSGPIQYPEYLTYSQGYEKRVCVDLSIVALKEARLRIGEHGLFVVGDVANLPFMTEVFEGAVSLHTFHHLPADEQKSAYQQLYRVLRDGCQAVVVNGWTDSALMRRSRWLVEGMERVGQVWARLWGRKIGQPAGTAMRPSEGKKEPTGTYVRKRDAAGLRADLNGRMDFEILVWRSVSVRFLRAMIHRILGGRYWLRLLYSLEERFPRYFGENGQYPLIVIRK